MVTNIRFFLFAIVLLKCPTLFAQDKFGNEWFIGIANYKLQFIGDTTLVSFLNPADTLSYIANSNANICDSNGHLLLATDAIKLYNGLGEFVSGGGENINNDSIVWGNGDDNAYLNNAIILPKGNNQYYVFVSTVSDAKYMKWYNFGDTFDYNQIRYSAVNMDANEGKGEIIIKNKLLLQVEETPWLNKSNFTACRHANGRDWWLLTPSARMRQVLYKFLVTPDSIYTFVENRPLYFDKYAYDNVGQSAFSKDGSLYVECNNNGPHTIYYFDRCSGELSLKRLINCYPFRDTFGTSLDNSNQWRGVCLSPNNRFLYTSDAFNIYQIDLNESNDSLAIKRVSKDTNNNPLPLGFPQYACMQLTPTAQIYLGNWHGISSEINGIMHPDKLGDSCGFKFAYSKIRLFSFLGYNNTNGPPNMPFYGLGALKGSPCDTLNPPPPPIPVFTSIRIYPNPVHEALSVELPSAAKKASIHIYNMFGQLMETETYTQIPNSKISMSVRHLANAMYTIKIVADEERFVGKFVKE